MRISGSPYSAVVILAPIAVASNQTARVSVKLSKAARTALHRAGTGQATVTLKAASTNGVRTRIPVQVKLRAG